jgi:hypothetical protein
MGQEFGAKILVTGLALAAFGDMIPMVGIDWG